MRIEPIMQLSNSVGDHDRLHGLASGGLAEIASFIAIKEPKLFSALFTDSNETKASILIFLNGAQVDTSEYTTIQFSEADTVTFVPIFAGG